MNLRMGRFDDRATRPARGPAELLRWLGGGVAPAGWGVANVLAIYQCDTATPLVDSLGLGPNLVAAGGPLTRYHARRPHSGRCAKPVPAPADQGPARCQRCVDLNIPCDLPPSVIATGSA